MREFLNEDTLFATIGILLGSDSGLILVVEGDDDHLLLKEHNSQDLRLIPGTGGREQVLRAAALAQQRGLSRARFLVDSDYDAFGRTSSPELANVFYSENHDCFMDLVFVDQKRLARIIDVHLDRVRRQPGNSLSVPAPGAVVRDTFSLAGHLAAVRIIDKRLGLSIDFKKFSFGGLQVSEFSASSVSQVVLARSPHINDRAEEVLSRVEETRAEVDGLPRSPVGDHDLFNALARVMRCHGVSVKGKDLQQDFILAVRCFSILSTRWFKEIEAWCASAGHVGFTCRQEISLAA